MPTSLPDLSTRRIVAVGAAGLAAAMGIGRFAFTPLLPLMQAGGLALSQGAWLAGGNYLGYLLGALACAARPPRPAQAARLGLLAVALLTLAMAAADAFALALALRTAAGAASAYVLVGLSAWALPLLAARGRGDGAGIVYAGVGLGMVLAGGVAIAVAVAGGSARLGWALLGILAIALVALGWRPLAVAPPAAASRGAATALPRGVAARLVLCYGAFGFGYILPATFLPAMARQLVADPAVFGWTWPVFGAAAAVSTLVGGALSRRVDPRRLWAASHVVMAAGVVLPALAPARLGALVVSAVAIGGTFMVATMAGLQEARRLAGAAAPRLMAAMTAAFGTGQLAGPLVVAGLGERATVVGAALAAALLLVSAAVLYASSWRPTPLPTSP